VRACVFYMIEWAVAFVDREYKRIRLCVNGPLHEVAGTAA
jgi:hypothetical protein